ncbi:MAG: sigma-70 family RNA polymerase sigma factor [Bacteroidia bacterium]
MNQQILHKFTQLNPLRHDETPTLLNTNIIKMNYHQADEEILNDEQAVNAAKLNPQKFEWLYDKYYEQIFRFTYQRLDSKDTAYDITQTVFLNAMLKLKLYQHRGLPFSSWLYRIAINELNTLFRKNKNERALNVDLDTVGDIIQEMEMTNTEEKIQEVLNAVQQLNEDEIQLIEMRFFERRAFKEVGEFLEITENNAKVKTYRALDKLREILIEN